MDKDIILNSSGKKPCSKRFQLSPVKSSGHDSNSYKNVCTPSRSGPEIWLTCPSFTHTDPVPKNIKTKPRHHPLFPFINPLSKYEPYYLHGAAINGDPVALQHALSDGGLCLLESRDRLGRTPLIYACFGDRPECVSVLLNAGASSMSVDSLGRNAFHWAALKGLYRCFKLMFKHERKFVGGDFSGYEAGWRMKDNVGATPLHLSATATATKCCSYILKNCIADDIDCSDLKKRTPLHWAAAAGNAEAVQILLKYNSKFDASDENGKTPLLYAASATKNNPSLCAQILLGNFPHALAHSDKEGRSALHLAAADQPDGAAMVAILIKFTKHGIQMRDKTGKTPLHWVAILGKVLTARILLKHFPDMLICRDVHGATSSHYASMNNFVGFLRESMALDRYSIDIADFRGQTPLMWAAAKNSCNAVEELVTMGAKLEHTDEEGYSVLQVAVMNGSTQSVKLLLKLGAKVNTKDKNGNGPLAAACNFGHLNIFLCLTESGSLIEATNNQRRKPIHFAANEGHSLILSHLANLGADLNSKDFQGLTPLHIASHKGCIDCTSILLAKGAQCDVQDSDGCTPLHHAVEGNHYEVVGMLLDYHANPNILDFNGKTPLDVCNESTERILKSQLIKNGALTGNCVIANLQKTALQK